MFLINSMYTVYTFSFTIISFGVAAFQAILHTSIVSRRILHTLDSMHETPPVN